jgi:hypothetical protein
MCKSVKLKTLLMTRRSRIEARVGGNAELAARLQLLHLELYKMKDETTPPTTPGAADELAADIARANRLADEIFWEVLGPSGQSTLQ